MAKSMVAFAEKALVLFGDSVLGNPAHAELVAGDTYYHETHYAGLVDPEGRVNFYDGQVRVWVVKTIEIVHTMQEP